MRLMRSRADPGSSLPNRLNDLCDNLQSLRQRLCAGLAAALGDTVATMTRDAVLAVLGRLQPGSTNPSPAPALAPAQPWERPWWQEGPEDWEQDPYPERHPEYEDGWPPEPPQEKEPEQEAPATPPRLHLAARAALQAASWWLGRVRTRLVLLPALAVSLLAGVLSLWHAPTTTAWLNLADALGWLGGT